MSYPVLHFQKKDHSVPLVQKISNTTLVIMVDEEEDVTRDFS
jgi:hypothetical protein